MSKIRSVQKKICMISSLSNDFDSRLVKIANVLDRNGFKATLVCPWNVKEGSHGAAYFHPIPRITKRILRPINYPRIWSFISKNVYDIFYFDQIDILPLMALFRIIKRKPVVFDMRENYAEEALAGRNYIPKGLGPVLAKVVALAEKACIKIVRNLIVVVDEQENRYQKYSTNLIKIRNFATLELLKERKEDYDSREAVVLFTGGQTVSNGSLIFLDISRRVHELRPNVKFYCTDYFFHDDAFKGLFLEEVRRYALGEVVKILPYIISPKIMSYINMAKIGIIPNSNIKKNKMAIPVKTFEYMAGAIPVVASDHPYLKEFLGSNKAGLLADPDRPSQFVEHILFLIDNPGQAKAMGENGLRAFIEKYAWEREADKLSPFLEEIIAH